MKKIKIKKRYAKKNPCYWKARPYTIKGGMLHSVGCAQPKASVFARLFYSRTDGVCVHAFVSAITGTVIKVLPWKYLAGHCGGSANYTHFAVEMCEPKYIKYIGGGSFTVTNKKKAIKQATRAYNSAVKLFAYLFEKFNLDPMKDGVLISHAEGHKRGLASNHGDPEHLWRGLGLPFTMDGFRKDVKKLMAKK